MHEHIQQWDTGSRVRCSKKDTYRLCPGPSLGLQACHRSEIPAVDSTKALPPRPPDYSDDVVRAKVLLCPGSDPLNVVVVSGDHLAEVGDSLLVVPEKTAVPQGHLREALHPERQILPEDLAEEAKN